MSSKGYQIIENIEKKFRKINKIGVMVSSICLLIMMLLGVSDVFSSKILKIGGIPSVVELMKHMNVILVFMAVGYVTVERGHISINVLNDLIPDKGVQFMRGNGFLLSFILCCFLSWRSMILVSRYFKSLVQDSGVLSLLLWPFAVCLLIGCLMLTLSFLIVFIKNVFYFKKTEGAVEMGRER